MQNRTLLAAIAAAAFAAVVTPSISAAQDTTAKKTTESKGEVAMQPSFGSLISAINSGSANVDKLKSLTAVNASDVQFVNVEDLLKGNDVSALNNALSKNKEGVDSLHSALGSNPAIGLLLASDSAATTTSTMDTSKTSTSTMSSMSAKPSAKDVIAADVTSDNKVVLYYWKKPSSQ
jgi:hypothetical protein